MKKINFFHDSEEELTKSRKKYEQMLKDDPNKDEIISWLKDLGVNSNWGTWFINNYRKDPKIFNQENKTKLQHFSGMTHLDEVKNHRFDSNADFNTGMKLLQEAEQKGVKRVQENNKFVKPKGEKLIDLGDGWAWWDLGVGSCEDEAQAMGHCGNEPSEIEGDRILSLRKEKDFGNRKLYSPHLTFIENNGILGEMKGRNNNKPDPKYHFAISKLLESDRVEGIIGGGYAESENFSLKDFKENPKFASKYEEMIYNKPQLALDHMDEAIANGSEDMRSHLIDSISNMSIDVKRHLAGNTKSHHVLKELSKEDDPHVLYHMAGNMHTPDDMLEKLSDDDDPKVRERVASNVKTPTHVLDNMLKDSIQIKTQIARNPNISAKGLDTLLDTAMKINDTNLNNALVRNRHITPEMLHKLSSLEGSHLDSIAVNDKTLPETLDSMVKNFNSKKEHIIHLAHIARNPNTPKQTMQKLYEDNADISFIITNLAKNPSTPEHILRDLSQKKTDSQLVFEALATNPSTPHEIIQKLSNNHPHYVARNPSANQDLLHELYKQHKDDDFFRRSIGQNPNIPHSILRDLTNIVTSKKHIDDEQQEDVGVCNLAYEIVENKSSPPDIINKITNHLLDGKWGETSAGVLIEASRHPNLSHQHQHKLNDLHEAFGHTLLDNPNLSPDVIDKIHNRDYDVSHELLHGIASHPNTSSEILNKLSQNTSTRIRDAAMAHPNFKASNQVDPSKAIKSLSEKLELLRKYRNKLQQ